MTLHDGPRTAVALSTRRRTLHTDIVEGIGTLIRERRLVAGDRLPTEVELCGVLGVGRGRLREAIRILSALGYVEVRHGGGMFLASDPEPVTLQPLHAFVSLDLRTQLEILQIRRLIEIEAVVKACRASDGALVRQLRTVVEGLGAAELTLEDLVQLDLRFHFALVQGMGNHTLVRIYAHLGALFAAHLAETLRVPGSQRRSRREHAGILSAIERGNADSARREMMRHLDIVENRLRRRQAKRRGTASAVRSRRG